MNTSHPRSTTKKGIAQCLQRVTINPNIPMTDIQVYCHPNVRVGNWSEDWIAKHAAVQAFLEKQKTGQLTCMQLDRRVAWACEEVPLSKDLTYDAPLALQHLFTLGVVSADVSGVTLPTLPATLPVSVAVCPFTPTRRNVVQCRLYQASKFTRPSATSNAPRALHFGDQCYLTMAGLGTDERTWYLQSVPKSTLAYSPLGKQGQVNLTTQCTSACRWQLVPDDPYYQLERDGTPVLPGHRVCLQHCVSGHFLYIHPSVMYRNDFGLEHEVMTKPLAHPARDLVGYAFVVVVDQPEWMVTVDDVAKWQAELQESRRAEGVKE